MAPGDELLVDVNRDNDFGCRARNRLMLKAQKGNGMVFVDDDDLFLPGALDIARAYWNAEPGRIHLFRCDFGNGQYLWRTPEIVCGGISTQNFLVPQSVAGRALWTPRYAGDFDFIQAAELILPGPAWHEEILQRRGQD